MNNHKHYYPTSRTNADFRGIFISCCMWGHPIPTNISATHHYLGAHVTHRDDNQHYTDLVQIFSPDWYYSVEWGGEGLFQADVDPEFIEVFMGCFPW